MNVNEKLRALATKLAALCEGLENSNASAEDQAAKLAKEAQILLAHPVIEQPTATLVAHLQERIATYRGYNRMASMSESIGNDAVIQELEALLLLCPPPAQEIEATYEYVTEHVVYLRSNDEDRPLPHDWEGKTVVFRLKD